MYENQQRNYLKHILFEGRLLTLKSRISSLLVHIIVVMIQSDSIPKRHFYFI